MPHLPVTVHRFCSTPSSHSTHSGSRRRSPPMGRPQCYHNSTDRGAGVLGSCLPVPANWLPSAWSSLRGRGRWEQGTGRCGTVPCKVCRSFINNGQLCGLQKQNWSGVSLVWLTSLKYVDWLVFMVQVSELGTKQSYAQYIYWHAYIYYFINHIICSGRY